MLKPYGIPSILLNIKNSVILLFCALHIIAVNYSQAAPIYKWKGEDGRWHFSSTPPKGAASEKRDNIQVNSPGNFAPSDNLKSIQEKARNLRLYQEAISKGKVLKGMSGKEVIAAWGAPNRRHEKKLSIPPNEVISETWEWDVKGKSYGCRYIPTPKRVYELSNSPEQLSPTSKVCDQVKIVDLGTAYINLTNDIVTLIIGQQLIDKRQK